MLTPETKVIIAGDLSKTGSMCRRPKDGKVTAEYLLNNVFKSREEINRTVINSSRIIELVTELRTATLSGVNRDSIALIIEILVNIYKS